VLEQPYEYTARAPTALVGLPSTGCSPRRGGRGHGRADADRRYVHDDPIATLPAAGRAWWAGPRAPRAELVPAG
jgi:hypothetical protein